ncbi:MAG TPA: PP2C family serine/threonine-protein phosphatase [Pseudonocardiaceae bacterium]|jgi:serine/threonine protein phosphatase PrpC|nr:PP2C family serine/threonine-protein phosphatase [Pseudonocardiaceae bacterium]
MTDGSVVDSGAASACPGCGAEIFAGDRFCENCGNDLLLVTGGTPDATATVPTPRGCVACGAEIDADGFCTRCGVAQPAVRDRVELDLAGAAGVSDRGLRHHRNEDAMAIRVTADPDGSGSPEHVVAVVCDGVSTSERPDDASKAAADAAAEVLLAATRSGADLEAATRDAVDAALAAVVGLAGADAARNAPACTFVSAVVAGDNVTVGWVGDSRAYWLGEQPDSCCVTADDSWAQRMISSGALTEAEAFTDPRSHALVAWLGADAGVVEPHVRTVPLTGPGVVLVCSDGLWNYLPDAEELAAVALPKAVDAPFAVAVELTALAIDRGGHDNVTVVVVPFNPRSGDQ